MEEQGSYITEIQEALAMLGQGYGEIRVKDESNDHKYFTITPRIVRAYARNAHDLAVWETIKDVAGESGECFLNTEQTAILAGVSTGQVSNSRRYWLKIGFLKGEIKKDPGFTQSVWHLTIPDIWAKNIEWCEKHPKIEDRIKFRKEHRSLHRVKASSGEGKGSPGETKKRVIKKMDVNERTALLSNLYSENIGMITPLGADIIRNMAIDFTEESWYQPAFEIAVKNNARSINYVEAVLQGWKDHHFGWKPQKYNGRNGKDKPNGNNQSSSQQEYTPDDYRIAAEIRAARGLS